MRRREFIAVVGALTGWPSFAGAEAAPVPLIGILSDENPGLAAQTLEPFTQGLRNLGYVDGQNVRLQRRDSAGESDKLPSLAAELVDLRPNVILAIGTPATRAVHAKTRTIPIVFARIADPIGLGLVRSLARPKENLTGVSLLATDLSTKWLELLVAMVPSAKRIGVLWDPTFAAAGPQLEDIRKATLSLHLELVAAETRHADEFQAGVRMVGEHGAAALIALPCPLFAANATQLAQLMAQARLPAMFGRREHVEAGGLVSYGTNYADMYRRAATLVDKILKGARPGDIPVEQPTKFELVINLKTAEALGLTVSQSLLARADEVIE